MKKPKGLQSGIKLRGPDKVTRIPATLIGAAAEGGKPAWIRVKLPASPEVTRVRQLLRRRNLATVCEEASCPNLGECFAKGTATFMVMGEICTRRCPFCDVASGIPSPLDADEPRNLALAIAEMGLAYVVITSVDRDDLSDGGAGHFAACIAEIRLRCPNVRIEILVPDFKGKAGIALGVLSRERPDLFNHNLETVSRLYRQVRPGASYTGSLDLLLRYKNLAPGVITKSGIMVGLGEHMDEVKQVLSDLRRHGVDMLTIGQYLRPSRHHLPVARYVHPDEFLSLAEFATDLGFTSVASAPLVRSSYHADLQARNEFSQ